MEKGTTYIVRPRMEPRNRSSSVSRISAGARQVGVRALRVGEPLKGAGNHELAAELVVFLRRAVAPVDVIRLAQVRNPFDPGEQLPVRGWRGCGLRHGLQGLLVS